MAHSIRAALTTCQNRFFILALALAALLVFVAACSDPEPTATPTPVPPTATPTPEPTPTPSGPSTEQPAVGLGSLSLTAETTGQDILDRVSEAEAACLGTSLGAADHEAFAGGSVLNSYGEVGGLDPLYACLTGDNFVLFGVAFTSARAGLSGESHTCLIALGREHPDAVVTFLGIETPPEAVAALTAETHPYAIELFDCLNTKEKVDLTVHMWAQIGSYQLSGKELMTAFTEEEITCFTDSFGITRDQLEALIGSRQPGQTSSGATPCLTDETYGRIITTLLSVQFGGISEETGACIMNFAVEHPHFFELTRVGAFDESTMSEDEFSEIVEDGARIYGCMTDDELRALQEAEAHALATFGKST